MKVERVFDPANNRTVCYYVRGFVPAGMVEEVFIPVTDIVEARFVTRGLNLAAGSLDKARQRMEHVLANGVVNESEMPDVSPGLREAHDQIRRRAEEDRAVKPNPTGTPSWVDEINDAEWNRLHELCERVLSNPTGTPVAPGGEDSRD